MSVMTSYGPLIHESAKTTQPARTRTCKAHPDQLSSTRPAERARQSSACFAAHAAEGTKAGGGLTPPVPCLDTATIQLPRLEDSSGKGSHRAGAWGPHQPSAPLSWKGLPDSCTGVQGTAEAGRVYLSLATLGGEQQPMRVTHQAELRSCISPAFGTFTIPKKMTIFRQNIYLQCLAPVEEKLWWHPGQSHPPPLAVLVFLPSARTRWLPARPLLLTKCPPWWPAFTAKWLPEASRNCQGSAGLSLFCPSPPQDFILSAGIAWLLSALPAEEEARLALLFRVPLIILPQGQGGEERPQSPSPIVTFPHLKGSLVNYGRLKDYNS